MKLSAGPILKFCQNYKAMVFLQNFWKYWIQAWHIKSGIAALAC
jgi:hypothetical protein